MLHRGAFLSVVLLAYLVTCDVDTLSERAFLDPWGSLERSDGTVQLARRDGRTFDIAPNSLRTRFCVGDGNDSCYDYTVLFVQFDNCGVTAYPLSSIARFENTGDFSPTYCISATGSAKLSTATERDREVFLQESHWSMVGREVGSGEPVTVPFDELADFRRVGGP